MRNDLDALQQRYREFVEERDWEEFQTPKNIAEAISIESGELLECFLWHDNFDSDQVGDDPELVADIEEELADIVIYSLGMADRLEIDLGDAIEAKLNQNEQRFDAETAESISEELRQWKR